MTELGAGVSDIDLLTLVAEADDIGLHNGEEPQTRAFQALIRVLQRIDPGGTHILAGSRAPPIVARIQAAIKKL